MQAPFTNYAGQNNVVKCVRAACASRKRVSHTVQATNDTGISIPLPAETNAPIAVSANPTKDHCQTPRSRRHKQSIPTIMKNVRYQPNNPTETRTTIARTQKAAQHSELAISDSTGIQIPILPQARGSSNAPPQRIPRVDEVESRGWGRRAPQSPSSSSFGAPQGNNEIYNNDTVFRIGEINANDQNQTQLPYKYKTP